MSRRQCTSEAGPAPKAKRLSKVLTEMDFWNRTESEPITGCWLWLGSVTPNGCGKIKWRGRYMSTHRLAYTLAGGTLLPGLVIDHLCRQVCCVNPCHLQQVTQRENVFRTNAMSVRNARKTHCNDGHPFAGDNLRIAASGERVCRTCDRRRSRIGNANRRGKR